MKHIGIIQGCMLLLTSAACASGGHAPSSEPLVPPPVEAHADGPSAPSSISLDGTRLTLADLISVAGERNADIAMARERIGAARARIMETVGGLMPTVTGRLSWTRTDHPSHAFGMIVGQRKYDMALDVNDPGSTENFRPELVARWALFDGRVLSGIAVARRGLDVKKEELEAVKLAVTHAVTDAWYLVLSARANEKVTLGSITAIESELDAARQRDAHGATLKADLLSLEVRLAETRQARVVFRNGAEEGMAVLRFLLGLSRTESFDLEEEEKADPCDRSGGLDAAVRQALDNRPEIRAADRAVEMMEFRILAAAAERGPRLLAFGSYGLDDNDIHLSTEQDNWMLGIQLEMNVLDGGVTDGRILRAVRERNEVRLAGERLRQSIEREVRIAWQRLENAEERFETASRAVDLATEALRLVREQYRAGTAVVTRFLEAESALAGARARHLTALYEVRRTMAALEKSMGVLP